ncbi:VOC family protein [Halomicroarcula sp. S1AR25-4]|uniref:VOC family protein n=1 Tax=Haloarcula sp. S1AR25-4 TaxID=2950538 RepID=UPI002874F043|nr:VOC family protein [Halomicroarcula sp. S1AR25-4]MDS0277652.1 VOC family protein [Halomicroarcula sp. S1AR25-4]
MTDDGFLVGSLDHVELSVPDRYEAADWYNEALGFEIVEEFEHWADLRAYPLMTSSDDGNTMLALFKRPPIEYRSWHGTRKNGLKPKLTSIS